jgi:hypothetical protein
LNDQINYSLNNVQYKATPEAIAFIEKYKLESGVTEIIAKMRELMPQALEIQLELLDDPDCDCEPELCLRALFPDTLDDGTVYEALDRFDEAWWLDNSGRWDYRIEVRVG